MADIFLTREDRHKLQELYEIWNLNADPKAILPKLMDHNIISHRDKQEIDARKTEYDKNDYIFDNVLIKSPYDQLEIIYKILHNELGDSKHKHIANLLPRDTQNRSGRYREPFRQHAHDEDIFLEPIQATTSHSYSQVPTHSFSMPPAMDFGQSAAQPSRENEGPRLNPVQLNIDGAAQRQPHENTLHQSSSAQSVTQSTSRLGFYNTKPRNNKYTGKGVCAIIANFTGDLVGYEKDVEAIAGFFEGQLRYDVFGGDCQDLDYRNLTRDGFIRTLKKIQEYLNDSIAATKIDRFFLFILSHGDEYGIKTCAVDSDINQETDPETHLPQRVTPEEIINMFTHNNIPKMKDFPKCIFIQNCRGTEHVQAASVPDSPRPTLPPNQSISDIAIGADVLVCHATKLGKLSWVGQDGSWFIQETVNTFWEHHRDEHIIDLIGEVNNRISKKTGTGQAARNAMRVTVRQLPDICYSLRKKFYLSIPQNLVQ